MLRILLAFAFFISAELFSVSIPPAPMQNYLPVVLADDTGTSSEHSIYLIITSLDPNGVSCFLVPSTTTGICSYVYLSPTGNPSSYDVSVKLTDLPTADVPTTVVGNANAYMIFLPVDVSTRVYFSIDRQLYFKTSFNAGDKMIDISSPGFGYNDPNTYTLYQDCEFSISGAENPVDSSLVANGNISFVDFFSLPMQIAQYSYPSNELITVFPGALPSGIPTKTSRLSMLNTLSTAMVNSGNSSWQNLIVNYYIDPYTYYVWPYPGVTPCSGSSASTYTQLQPIRFLSSKNSIGLTALPEAFPVAPSGCIPMFGQFNPNYASTSYKNQGTTSVASYFQSLYNYYKSASLYLNFIPPGPDGICVYKMTSSGADLTLQFTYVSGFNYGSLITLLLGNDTIDGVPVSNGGLTTEELISGAATWPFSIGTGTNFGKQTAQVISALFGSGNLPLQQATGPGGAGCPSPPLGSYPSCDSWLGGNCPFPDSNCGTKYLTYFQNPPNPSFQTQGIWYNLYAQIIHEQETGSSTNPIPGSGCVDGCVPNNPTLGLGYAYDYDDLLNMSGLCTVTIQDGYGNPATSPAAPYLVFTLNTIEEETIPALFQSQTYKGMLARFFCSGVSKNFS
jgi:hypothetical protein